MNHMPNKPLTDQQRIALIRHLPGSGNITNKIDLNRSHGTYNPSDGSGFTTSGSASISRTW